jgi:hypothetical protein
LKLLFEVIFRYAIDVKNAAIHAKRDALRHNLRGGNRSP